MPQERRVPQQAVGRPLAEPHLAHVHRLDPRRRLRLRNLLAGSGSRRTRTAAHGGSSRTIGSSSALELVQQRVVESRADAAGVDERPVHHVGELQRAEVRATALRRGESDDDEVAGLLRLDLEPVVAAAAAIRRVGLLGDDSLEAERVHLLEKRFAFALDVVERAQRRRASAARP